MCYGLLEPSWPVDRIDIAQAASGNAACQLTQIKAGLREYGQLLGD
jgi:hypothetical protein